MFRTMFDIWVHSNMHLVEMFMNWDGLAQLPDVSGHAFQPPDKPKLDPSKAFKHVSSRAEILWDPPQNTSNDMQICDHPETSKHRNT